MWKMLLCKAYILRPAFETIIKDAMRLAMLFLHIIDIPIHLTINITIVKRKKSSRRNVIIILF